jgi:signal transduction histidine kinase/DNA-binding response OmpR family regulator
LRADGTEFPVEITVSPLHTEDGILSLSAIRDVTERKKNDQRSRQLEIVAAEAEAASKAKSRFLSTVSHEIRTPMNAILGYSQLMLRDPNLGSSAKDNLTVISRSGEHLLTIINDVLDMAKIEAGRMNLTTTAFNLRTLVRDMESMFQLRAVAKNIQFEVLVAGEPIEDIVADEGKLRQVLINLLGNAVKFTERGRIALNVSLDHRADGRLWLSARIEDTGIGLTPEDQSRLFQPFVQGRTEPHTHEGGTGLGLAICRGVAVLMGGEIKFNSQLGSGSTFSLEIPVELGHPPQIHQQPPGFRRVLGLEAGVQAPRILIADDVKDNREWLSRLLTVLGFAVRSVENGEIAVRCWEQWRPQLILMDVHMPVMDGLEATRFIKASPMGRDTVIIALTADVLDGQRLIVLDSGMDDFLSKPCREGELLEKIRSHLGLVYVYDEETNQGQTKTSASRAQTGLTSEQLAELPAHLRGQLLDATLNGNKRLLNSLILQIREAGRNQTAVFLQELADTYEYKKLIKLLETSCRP